MYKTKVQELCQRRSWSLPEYNTTRDGPDHNPRFTSTVTVNGLRFETPSPCRTSKEAQNTAAMLAFEHFSQPPSTPPPPPPNPMLMLRPKPMPMPTPTPTPMPMPMPMPSPPPPRPLLQEPTLPGLDSFPQPTLPGLSSFPQPSLFAPSAASSSSSLSYFSSGPSTDVDNILPTSRVLQEKLEETGQIPQIGSPVTGVRDIVTTGDQKNMAHLFKNQLQNYAQKRNLKLPVYSSEWEGPPHCMRFKCKVTVDGQTYECPKFFSTLKDAEHAAAEVALTSLSPGGFQEDHTVLYKNLLQELAQKEGFRLPVYNTERSGEAHVPTFVSQVEVEGEVFTGQEAKTKKQAEMSAAKVAYTTLKERKGESEQRSLFPLSDNQGKAPQFLSDCSESNVITGLQHHANPKHPVSPGVVSSSQPGKNKEPVATVKKGSSSSGSTNGCTKDSSSSNGQSAPSLSDSTNAASDTNNMPSTAAATPAGRRRVVVYSRETTVKIEEGGTLKPFSDDKWVAYSYSH